MRLGIYLIILFAACVSSLAHPLLAFDDKGFMKGGGVGAKLPGVFKRDGYSATKGRS